MNNIPRGTPRATLIQYLRHSPHGQQQTSSGPEQDVICSILMADSRLDDELSVARIEFSVTPGWLEDLNTDPKGFPMKTALGTLWRGIDTATGEPDESGQTELIRAVVRGDSHYAAMLLEFPETLVNVQDKRGRTALHWACVEGHDDLAGLCLSITSCDVGICDVDGLTALDITRLHHDRSEAIQNLFYRRMIDLDETHPQAALLRVLTPTAEPASNVDSPIFPAQAILDPVRDQNWPLVSALVKRGIDPTGRDAHGNSALHVALDIGNTDVVVQLLQGGSDTDAVDSAGVTAVQHAHHVGVEMAPVLLDWEDHTLAKGEIGAAVTDPAAPAESLPADTDPKHDETTDPVSNAGSGPIPLLEASRDGDLTAVQRLLEHGADVNSTDGYGQTALQLAAEFGHTDIVRMLLASEAMMEVQDLNGWTPLQCASNRGHISVVQVLLAAGADIHAFNLLGMRPLHHAATGGHTEIVQALLVVGADANAVAVDRSTALHLAVDDGCVESVQALLRAGADTEARDENNWTALHIAASGQNVESVRALLAAGALTEAINDDRCTALHQAAGYGNIETVQALLAAGANTAAKDRDQLTALHLAARYESVDIVQALLAAGADVDALDKKKRTALYMVVEGGSVKAVKALLAAGANIDNRATGRTPLQIAKKNKYRELVDILLEAGAETDPGGFRNGLLQPLRRGN